MRIPKRLYSYGVESAATFNSLPSRLATIVPPYHPGPAGREDAVRKLLPEQRYNRRQYTFISSWLFNLYINGRSRPHHAHHRENEHANPSLRLEWSLASEGYVRNVATRSAEPQRHHDSRHGNHHGRASRTASHATNCRSANRNPPAACASSRGWRELLGREDVTLWKSGPGRHKEWRLYPHAVHAVRATRQSLPDVLGTDTFGFQSGYLPTNLLRRLCMPGSAGSSRSSCRRGEKAAADWRIWAEAESGMQEFVEYDGNLQAPS